MKNVFPLMLVLVVAIVGCKSADSTSSSPSNANINSSTNTAAVADPSNKETMPAYTDPRKPVSDALQKFGSVPFATVRTESTVPDSGTTTEMFSAAENRYSQTSSSGDNSSTVIIATEKFWKMNQHWPWKKEPDPESAKERFFLRNDRIASSLADFNGTADGQEMVDGKPASVVTLTPFRPIPDGPTSIKIWIDAESGLPVKLVMELEKGTKTNTSTFDYRSPVKIVRPVVGKV